MATLAKIIGVFCILAGVGIGLLVLLGYYVAMSELPTYEPGRGEESAEALVGLLVGGVVVVLLAGFGVGMWLLGAANERRAPPPIGRYDPTVRH